MRKELTEMLEEHEKVKQEWVNIGSPGSFYEWLLERIEFNRKKYFTMGE